MLDSHARRLLAPVLDGAGGWLSEAGVSPTALTGVGWLAGVGACVAVAERAWYLGLGLWLVNRLLDGLDGPAARHRGATDLGGFLDIVADFSVYAGFVLAIAVAEPAARLACAALLTAYYVSGTAFLALSSLVERRGAGGGGRSLNFVGGLAEGTETIVVYAVFCAFPQDATAIAWVFAAMVVVTAAQRVRYGVGVLRRPAGRATASERVSDAQDKRSTAAVPAAAGGRRE